MSSSSPPASTDATRPALSTGEFVSLIALSSALAALSIDTMLPALPQIAVELGAARANDRQLVITAFVVGMAGGQVLYGPLSDALGRRPAMVAGYLVFLLGAALSALAGSFPLMLLGRVLQGVGAAGPRIVGMALVRDLHAGPGMARIMSFHTALFILVPVIAPTLGQAMIVGLGWRSIFALFLLLGTVALVWFVVRQPETLPPERRIPLSFRRIGAGLREVALHPVTRGYTLTAGLMFGALFGYVMSAQQVLGELYGLGDRFPYYFGAVALAIGASSLVNARLVMTYGMQRMVRAALATFVGLSLVLAAVALWLAPGKPPLWGLMGFLLVSFFCVGMLFGNFNALAMEPMGHIAGLAAAVIGSMTTLISGTCGTLIGQSYQGTVVPLVLGFTGLSSAALLLMLWVERRRGAGTSE